MVLSPYRSGYSKSATILHPDFSCLSVNGLPGVGGDIEDTADGLRSLAGRVGRERLREGRGEVLASFLPGVTTTTTKLLTSQPNLGQVCV